jgi:hypothetical protein
MLAFTLERRRPIRRRYLEQQAKGLTAALGIGYVFTGKLAFNMGLRYQHVFVSDDPSLDLFSLRLSYPLAFRRRED